VASNVVRRAKSVAKRLLPASWIYFYHSLRVALKLGILPELIRTLRNAPEKLRLGGEGGWTIPRSRFDAESICYCVGCGEDISFDLELIGRFACTVFAFDPTPRAIVHVAKHAGDNPRYHFSKIAIWEKEDTVRFYAPGEALGVSHSITNLDGTNEYIEVPAKRLAQVLAENGHSAITLLKMDIEGAEHTVIKTIVDDRLPVDVVCVEFDELAKYGTPERLATIRASIRRLLDAGYAYFWIEGSNFTFVRQGA
jgi:FkbM family methyltransferase